MRRTLLLILSMVLFAAGCGENTPTPKFQNGQIVHTKMGKLEAQVISTDCWNYCEYRIRIAQNYSVWYVREHEIE